MKWQQITLGEILHVKHGWAFKSEYFSDTGQHIVLTPGNFYEEGGFKSRGDKDRFYSGEYPSEYLLSKDNLIIAMTEQGEGLLGSAALIPEDNRYLHNQRLGLVTIRDDIIADSFFVYKLFNTQAVRQQISGSASGAKVKHTAPERIYKCKVQLPPLHIQQKIAAILSAYDDLIENNLKRIKLLQNMAQITYDEWFLYQRIGNKHIADDEFEYCILNTIVADYKNGGWGKEESEGAYTFEAFVIRGTDMPDLKSGNYDTLPLRFHTPNNLSARKLLPGDICIEMSNGNIDNIGRSFYFDESLANQLGKDVMCASFCKLLRPKNSDLSYLIDMHLKYIHKNNQMLVYKSQGANGINNFQFENMISEESLPVPKGEALDEIIASFHSVYRTVSTLRRQNHLLKEARNILLPRLMTGMIDVEQLVLPEPFSNTSSSSEQESQAA